MKQKIISIFILILLSSCSSIAPAPTATALPASTNTHLPTKPPTSAPTQTATPTESLTASYQKIEAEYIATLSPEQKALYEQYNSKDRTAEGLTRRFLDGDLSTYLAYVDMNKDSKDYGEVTSVWNPEQQKPNPALLIENNLFINENSASEIIWNPDMDRDKAKQIMADYMKYVRLKLVAEASGIDLSNTLEGALTNEKAQKLLTEGHIVTLHDASASYKSNGIDVKYSVPSQLIEVASDTSIVFKIVSTTDANMILSTGYDKDNGKIIQDGVSFIQSANGSLNINFYHTGNENLLGYSEYKDLVFVRRLAFSFDAFVTRSSRPLRGAGNVGDIDAVTARTIFDPYLTIKEPLILFR